ncbi:hypothetical protein E2R51_18140 [Jeotgalibacillus sp. S-D1]|uniref:hypothetical protein n=1 Tax=Jeotgalibacillus sp. S-D1 TaxID=2552189 RepID=UPI001059A661|nr:hypothetical protein [Jeotgalibacillus sp. S-D1]TDL30460.1 hypothetical protein E2R51_18140 [Jeotgalibacillus sp. S-D1]
MEGEHGVLGEYRWLAVEWDIDHVYRFIKQIGAYIDQLFQYIDHDLHFIGQPRPHQTFILLFTVFIDQHCEDIDHLHAYIILPAHVTATKKYRSCLQVYRTNRRIYRSTF